MKRSRDEILFMKHLYTEIVFFSSQDLKSTCLKLKKKTAIFLLYIFSLCLSYVFVFLSGYSKLLLFKYVCLFIIVCLSSQLSNISFWFFSRFFIHSLRRISSLYLARFISVSPRRNYIELGGGKSINRIAYRTLQLSERNTIRWGTR